VLVDGFAKRHNCDDVALLISDFQASVDDEASATNDAVADELAGAVDCPDFGKTTTSPSPHVSTWSCLFALRYGTDKSFGSEYLVRIRAKSGTIADVLPLGLALVRVNIAVSAESRLLAGAAECRVGCQRNRRSA